MNTIVLNWLIGIGLSFLVGLVGGLLMYLFNNRLGDD